MMIKKKRKSLYRGGGGGIRINICCFAYMYIILCIHGEFGNKKKIKQKGIKNVLLACVN